MYASFRQNGAAPVKALAAVYRTLAGATGEDVLAELQRTFDAVQVLPGSSEMIVLAIADKARHERRDASSTVTSGSDTV